MASRNGSPRVTPAAFRTALRLMCFFVMNMFSPKDRSSTTWPRQPSLPLFSERLPDPALNPAYETHRYSRYPKRWKIACNCLSQRREQWHVPEAYRSTPVGG